MKTHYRHAAIALALVAGTGTAEAQMVITREPVETEMIITRAPQLTPARRTTIYRTTIPQGRGRAPIVRERIVSEPVAPAPVLRERIVMQPVDRYDAYAYVPAPRERIVRPPADVYGDYAFAVGSRLPPGTRLAPLPPSVVAEVPAVRPYRYMVVNNRLLLVDPVTGTVVADITE